MSKHTPGPWRVQYVDWPNVIGADDKIVADCGALLRKVDVQDANARLIAAAPRMLTALKELVVAYDEDSREVREAKASIAEAEGR